MNPQLTELTQSGAGRRVAMPASQGSARSGPLRSPPCWSFPWSPRQATSRRALPPTTSTPRASALRWTARVPRWGTAPRLELPASPQTDRIARQPKGYEMHRRRRSVRERSSAFLWPQTATATARRPAISGGHAPPPTSTALLVQACRRQTGPTNARNAPPRQPIASDISTTLTEPVRHYRTRHRPTGQNAALQRHQPALTAHRGHPGPRSPLPRALIEELVARGGRHIVEGSTEPSGGV